MHVGIEHACDGAVLLARKLGSAHPSSAIISKQMSREKVTAWARFPIGLSNSCPGGSYALSH